MEDKVTTYYLEMRSPDALKSKSAGEELRIEECQVKQFEVNRFFYQLVGGPWQWTGKLSWSEEQWREYAEQDGLRLWAAYCNGSPAGYYELHKQDEGNVEIAYFGLAPPFIGEGFGGYLLSHAIASAWEWEGTKRVWVHTCTLDHEGALANYEARGMTLYKTLVTSLEERP